MKPITKEDVEWQQLSDEHSVKVTDIKEAVEWLINKLETSELDYNSEADTTRFVKEAFEGVLE